MSDLEQVSQLSVCAHCYDKVRFNARYCGNCGASLSASAPPVAQNLVEEREAAIGRSWDVLKRLIVFYGILLGTSLLAGIAVRWVSAPLVTAVLTAVDAFVVVVFGVLHRSEIAPLLKVAMPSRRLFLFWAAGTGLLFVGGNIYFIALESFGVPVSASSAGMLEQGWPAWAIFLCISVMPAIFEEIAFRGVIYGGLRRVLTGKEALVVQAALFSCLHISPLIFVSHFFMGLVFGWLRVKTSSLLPCMLLHGLWNAVVVASEIYFQ